MSTFVFLSQFSHIDRKIFAQHLQLSTYGTKRDNFFDIQIENTLHYIFAEKSFQKHFEFVIFFPKKRENSETFTPKLAIFQM